MITKKSKRGHVPNQQLKAFIHGEAYFHQETEDLSSTTGSHGYKKLVMQRNLMKPELSSIDEFAGTNLMDNVASISGGTLNEFRTNIQEEASDFMETDFRPRSWSEADKDKLLNICHSKSLRENSLLDLADIISDCSSRDVTNQKCDKFQNGCISPFKKGGPPDSIPSPEWLCFMRGTKISITNNFKYSYKVEDLKTICPQFDKLSEDGLLLLKMKPVEIPDIPVLNAGEPYYSDSGGGKTYLYFYYKTSETYITAECDNHHPFFVKNRGWCSIQPELSSNRYLIQMNKLDVGSVCLPLDHPLTILSNDAMHKLSLYDFSMTDIYAVIALYCMAVQKKHVTAVETTPKCIEVSPDSLPSSKLIETKSKRPMNAFMIFAKKHRMDYINKYPGRDNRAISVMLGDVWRKMPSSERSSFLKEARFLAENQKRINPNCWKRKRSVSTCT